MADFNKFTNYSQELLNSAGAIMQAHKNSELQPEHIMLAMIKDNGAIKDYLTELKLLNQGFIDKIVSVVNSFPTISGPPSGQVDRKSTRLNSSHIEESRMPSSA